MGTASAGDTKEPEKIRFPSPKTQKALKNRALRAPETLPDRPKLGFALLKKRMLTDHAKLRVTVQVPDVTVGLALKKWGPPPPGPKKR